jgi:hypothetical protein
MFAVLFVAVASSALAQSADPNQMPTAPALGPYSNTLSKICGRNKVDLNPTSIPFIGCFALKAGSSLTGDIDGRSITIRVSLQGDETYEIDGVTLRRTGSSTTNVEGIKPGGSGFTFCTSQQLRDCPILGALLRQPGRFVSFDVSRSFKPRSYVTNQENWDIESKR